MRGTMQDAAKAQAACACVAVAARCVLKYVCLGTILVSVFVCGNLAYVFATQRPHHPWRYNCTGQEFEVGWYVDADGHRVDFCRELFLYQWTSIDDALVQATRNRTPKQTTGYMQYRYGVCVLWLSVYVTPFPLEGVSLAVPQQMLQPFPIMRFDSIDPLGLLLDVLIAGAAVYIVSMLVRIILKLWRRDPDMNKVVRCRTCGYDLRGAPTDICSECGTHFTKERELPGHD